MAFVKQSEVTYTVQLTQNELEVIAAITGMMNSEGEVGAIIYDLYNSVEQYCKLSPREMFSTPAKQKGDYKFNG